MRDYQQVLSDKQAFTADAVSTNVFDTGIASDANGVGAGNPQFVEFIVAEAFDNITSCKLTVESSDGLTSGALNSSKVENASKTVLLAGLTLGARYVLPLPPTGVKRYIGAAYDVTGTTNTTGKISATIVSEQPRTQV